MGFEKDSPEYLFRKMDRSHRLALDRYLAELGLQEIGNPMLLISLSRAGGQVESQRDLAESLRVTPAAVTVSLKSMERLGYVRKMSDEHDMRRKRIAITKKGEDAVRLIDRAYSLVDRSMYRGFSPEERDAISEFFRRIISNLELPAFDCGCPDGEQAPRLCGQQDDQAVPEGSGRCAGAAGPFQENDV